MSQKGVNPFLRQRYFNRASQPSWREFAAHREQITSRLEAASADSRSLCVLGAGNCNDLDLVRLAARFDSVRLVDLDAEAMQAGVANQFQLAGVPQGKVDFTACDLTGAMELCHEIAQAPSGEAFARLRGTLSQLPAVRQLGTQFSTVASTCLLSQLILILQRATGASHPEFQSLAALIRLQHLRTLGELTAPGGTAILFADFVSSETHPEILAAPTGALPGIMEKVLREQACFPGMNPHVLLRVLGEPPLSAYWEGPAEMSAPWVWNLGPRSYLVTAITCRRTKADDRSWLAL